MISYFRKNFIDLSLILVIFLTSAPFLFYKLGQSSLVSWDEAWYATIARNALLSHDFLHLSWNGQPYLDHPPLGFVLTAISFNLLGINEFSAKLPQAISGCFSLITIYFLGKEVFKSRLVGFLSTLGLLSSTWFLYRARTADLDSLLTFFFLLVIYFGIKLNQSKKYFTAFVISLIGLFFTKTMVPFTIIPVLFLIFYKSENFYLFKKSLLILVAIFGGFIFYNFLLNHDYLRNYLLIGSRGVGIHTNYLANILLTKEYLHNGIGKWFWLGIFGLFFSIISFQKKFYIFPLFFLIFILPFIFSAKGHIWHLIPLHPILVLSFVGITYYFIYKFLRPIKLLLLIILMGFLLYISFIQARQNFYQFIDIPKYISDDAILSSEAAKYPQILLTDGDFDPVATFYSDKSVRKIKRDELESLFKNNAQFLLITEKWRLVEGKISNDSYQQIKSDRDKVLVLHN